MFTRRATLKLFAGAAAAAPLARRCRARRTRPTNSASAGRRAACSRSPRASGALEKRLAPRGIKVTWSEFTSGPPLLEALGANAIDFGSTGDIPPLFAQAAGGDLRLCRGEQGQRSTARRSSSSRTRRSRSLADLKGKKVAFKRGSSSHNFAVKALRTVGLTLGDVDALDLGPPDAAPAFANNQIDAWVIWDPYYAIAEQDARYARAGDDRRHRRLAGATTSPTAPTPRPTRPSSPR